MREKPKELLNHFGRDLKIMGHRLNALVKPNQVKAGDFLIQQGKDVTVELEHVSSTYKIEYPARKLDDTVRYEFPLEILLTNVGEYASDLEVFLSLRTRIPSATNNDFSHKIHSLEPSHRLKL